MPGTSTRPFSHVMVMLARLELCYHVILRCVRFQLWKHNKYYIFWVCVCDFGYSICYAHAPYGIVNCDLSGLNIFVHFSPKWHDFWKKVIVHKECLLILSTNFVWNVFDFKEKSAKYHKCILVLMHTTSYFCQIWMKLEFYREILWKKKPQISHLSGFITAVAIFR
jgi:hypothetical protein